MLAFRLSGSDGWEYVPLDHEGRARLVRLARGGIVESHPDGVRMRSDEGPILWSDVSRPTDPQKPFPLPMLKLVGRGFIELFPDERIVFGESKDGAYDPLVGMTLCKRPGAQAGFRMSMGRVEPGDVVLTAWSNGRDLIPARVSRLGRRLGLELVEPHPAGERCFVLDETGSFLVTASMASNGTENVAILPPSSLDSWLFSMGSNAMKARSERFHVDPQGGMFVLSDKKTGKKYQASYENDHENNPQAWNNEQEMLIWMLASKGLAGILPKYTLKRA